MWETETAGAARLVRVVVNGGSQDTGESEKVPAPFRDRIVYLRALYQWRGRQAYKLKTPS